MNGLYYFIVHWYFYGFNCYSKNVDFGFVFEPWLSYIINNGFWKTKNNGWMRDYGEFLNTALYSLPFSVLQSSKDAREPHSVVFLQLFYTLLVSVVSGNTRARVNHSSNIQVVYSYVLSCLGLYIFIHRILN